MGLAAVGIHQLADVSEGASVDPEASVEAHAFVGSGCLVARDAVIGVRATLLDADPGAPTRIEHGATIGAGSVINAGVTIGSRAVVRAGTVIDSDVPPGAIVEGNPAAVVGYSGVDPFEGARFITPPSKPGESIDFAGCSVIRLPQVIDLRGALTYGEVGQYLPFEPQRFFVVYDVPSAQIRGSHAHRQLHEWIVVVKGSVTVTADDGTDRAQVLLDDPTLALHLRPMTWTTQYAYSEGAVLVVLCSHKYEDADYIRDYDDYVSMVR
jgi:carbonic anhydrase/acetyltransferase-like protein (isoleucine patch superfamily)